MVSYSIEKERWQHAAVWNKKPILLIYLGAAEAAVAVALALGILLITSISFRHSLANIPFVFLNGQEMEVL